MKHWLIISLCFLTIVAFVYPSAFIYPKDTLPDSNDTRLLAYIVGQVQNNLTTHQNLYYGTFFAPEPNTLTYSDLFLTSSVLTLPLRFFTDSPVLIFNTIVVLSFFFTLLTAYLLFRYLFRNPYLAFLSSLLFNLSGFHLAYLPHQQIFSFWMVFLALYFFLRYQSENKKLFLHLILILATMQLAESIFTFYLLFFALLFLYLQTHKNSKQVILHSLFYLPFWIALLYPYFRLHLTYPEAVRPIRDAAHFSLGLDEIFFKFHAWTLIAPFLTITLHKLAFKLRPKPTSLNTAFIYLFFFSLFMSLGPVLKLSGQTVKVLGLPLPLPYSLFYYFFPGFNGFRTPSRFILLAAFAATTIIGYYLLPLFNKLQTKTKVILLGLTLSFLFIEADLPLKSYPVNINRHPVYEQVKALPKESIILELPIKLWNMPDHEIESIRSLYSLYHEHRRVGGFSGFATQRWISLVESLNTYGLTPDTITSLKSLGVTHVIDNNRLSKL